MRSLEYKSKNTCSLKQLCDNSKNTESSKRLRLGSTIFRDNKYRYAYRFYKSFLNIAMTKDEKFISMDDLSCNNEFEGIQYCRIINSPSTLRSKI